MITSTTPITPAIREALSDALTSAIDGDDSISRQGAPGYLATLHATRDGDALGDLIDVVEYFVLDLDA